MRSCQISPPDLTSEVTHTALWRTFELRCLHLRILTEIASVHTDGIVPLRTFPTVFTATRHMEMWMAKHNTVSTGKILEKLGLMGR